MKKLFLVVLMLGLVLSCSKPVAKEDTQKFVNDFQTKNENLYANVSNSKGFKALKSMPSGAILKKFSESSFMKLNIPHVASLTSNFIFGKGKDVSGFGTYEWHDTIWVCTDSTYPANGFLFKWTYYDSVENKNVNASFLFDSLEIQVIGSDTIPKKAHALLKADDTNLVQGRFDANWVPVDTIAAPKDLNANITFYGIAQFGIELIDVSWELTPDGEGIEPRSGTFHFWVIDYQNNNYRVDYTVKMLSQTHATFTAEDSDKWKIFVDATAVLGDTTVATLDGEITHSNKHAADIDGKIYEPDNYENPRSYVDVIYPDGTKERVYPETAR
jgi:hypothetical protein